MSRAFRFAASPFVPFRERSEIDRCRRIKRADIEKHPNPDFRIRVLPDADFEMMFVTDLFHRIKVAADGGQQLVLILPNPIPWYRHVAGLINRFRVNCRHLHLFAMDEFANERGEIAPVDWPKSLGGGMQRYLVSQIDPELRPPKKQVHYLTDANLHDYGRMITDLGEADMIYTGPGWSGHLAFIEPDAPELDLPLEQWTKRGPCVVTLSPFSLAQQSLHGNFGMSGDLAAVPPKGATIGPAQVVAAKERMDISAFTIHGTATTWQRMIARLCYHGPVTPRLPTSIHQTLRTDAYLSESIASDIEPDWDKGY